MADQPKPTVVVGVVVIRDGKLLVARRKTGNHAGKLDTPGGKLEFGESFKQAAARELKEEAGLTAKRFILLTVVNAYEAGVESHPVVICLLAVGVTGEPVNHEPDKKEDWIWFNMVSDPIDDLIYSIRAMTVSFSINRLALMSQV